MFIATPTSSYFSCSSLNCKEKSIPVLFASSRTCTQSYILKQESNRLFLGESSDFHICISLYSVKESNISIDFWYPKIITYHLYQDPFLDVDTTYQIHKFMPTSFKFNYIHEVYTENDMKNWSHAVKRMQYQILKKPTS